MTDKDLDELLVRLDDTGGVFWDLHRDAAAAIRQLRGEGEPVADPERIAQLIAHRACCGVEHDPQNGKLHGLCVVCGVPWPCAYAGSPPGVVVPESALRYLFDSTAEDGQWEESGVHNFVKAMLAARPGAQNAKETVSQSTVSKDWHSLEVKPNERSNRSGNQETDGSKSEHREIRGSSAIFTSGAESGSRIHNDGERQEVGAQNAAGQDKADYDARIGPSESRPRPASAAPTSQDAKDAARYRWLRDENKRIDYTSDWKSRTPSGRLLEALSDEGVPECFKITLLLHHVPKDGEPIWKDGGHIDWAANMDAAIDAAMQQDGLAPEKEKP